MTSAKDRPELDADYGLEEVDVLRERLDASYGEAKAALDATEGDVVAALALIEAQRAEASPGMTKLAQEVAEEVRRVVSGGEVTSAKVTVCGQPVLTATLALAGVAGAAIIILGALISHCGVEVAVGEREEAAT
jgi:hypothetical protein